MAHEHSIDIEVNLADQNRSSRNIGLDWGISIPPRKKGVLARLFSSGADKIEKNVILKLEDFSMPDELTTNGPLITLIKDGEYVDQDKLPLNLTLTSLETTFSVFLNERNILDYKIPHDLVPIRVPVKFTLVAQDSDTGINIDSVKVNLYLILTKIETVPNIEMNLNDVKYNSTVSEDFIGYI